MRTILLANYSYMDMVVSYFSFLIKKYFSIEFMPFGYSKDKKQKFKRISVKGRKSQALMRVWVDETYKIEECNFTTEGIMRFEHFTCIRFYRNILGLWKLDPGNGKEIMNGSLQN